ncbi:hypothetical protein BC829DRAFT_386217, partial [Chytridium lagenaria]
MLTLLLIALWVFPKKDEVVKDNGPPAGWAVYQGDLSWNDIKTIVKTQDFDRFSRQQYVLEEYMRWRADTTKKYASSADFIKIEVLSTSFEIDSQGRKVAKDDDNQYQSQRIILRPNNFPYATVAEEKIQHLVLWYTGKDDISPKAVENILKDKMPGFEFIFYVNPPHKKTIPEINHYQVFARPQADIN